MLHRNQLRYRLQHLNVNCDSPAQTFAAFLLARALYKQHRSGITDPSELIERVRPFLDRSGILDVIPLKCISGRLLDWVRFALLIQNMDGLEYVELMHPCYLHHFDFSAELETIPIGKEDQNLYQLILNHFVLAEDPRFDPLLADSNEHHAFSVFTEKDEFSDIDAGSFFELRSKLFYTELKKLDTNHVRIRKFYGFYRKKGYTKQTLLTDYARGKYENIFPPVFLKLDGMIEQGNSDEELKFRDDFNYLCKKFRPTDVIQSLFYDDSRDDHSFEVAYILPKVCFLAPRGRNTLIVNPSPLFLYSLGLEKKSENWNVCVAVPDATVRDLYRRQFPQYHIVCCCGLADLGEYFDNVIVIARDLQYEAYRDGFKRCARNGHLVYYGPETVLNTGEASLFSELSAENIWTETILRVAKEATSSIGRRKLMLFARKGKEYETDQLLLLSSFVRDFHFYVERKALPIPYEWLREKLTLVQMRDRYFRMEDSQRAHYDDPSVYYVSKEIRLYYVELSRRDCVSAKVCYRAIVGNHPKDRRRKYGEKLAGYTEKGMRCKDPEELPGRLEQLAFDPEFFGIIRKDLLEKYPDTSSLSMKSIWYLCRNDLISFSAAYRAEEMDRFFFSCADAVRDMVPGRMTGEQIMALLEAELDPHRIPGMIRQFHIILKQAANAGFIPEITVDRTYQERIRNGRNRLQELQNSLGKKCFTEEEERNILHYLMEPRGRRKVSRCVEESVWLIGLIRLYTGMPLREVLALRWMDLYQDPFTGVYSLRVSCRLNDQAHLIGYGWTDRRKCRVVPLHPYLTSSLLARRLWLQERLGFTQEEVMTQPMILDLEPNRNRRKCAWKHCPIPTGRKITRIVLEQADIPEDKILLLEGDARFEHDLNAYKGDLFHANFLHRLIHTCAFTLGQRSYVTGVEPKDTFSAHYVDFANCLIQYQMICKLGRWTIEKGSIDTENSQWQYQWIRDRQEFTVGSRAGAFCSAEMSLFPADDGEDLTITTQSGDFNVDQILRSYRTGGA